LQYKLLQSVPILSPQMIDLLNEFLKHGGCLSRLAVKCLKLGLNYGVAAVRDEYGPISATSYKLWLGPIVRVWRVVTLRLASLSHLDSCEWEQLYWIVGPGK